MTNRLTRFQQHTRANRHALGWFGVVAAVAALAALSISCAAQAAEPTATEGLMLRPGDWTQDAGGYVLPASLASSPDQWPASGWYRVTHKASALQVQTVPAPVRGLPPFLHDIAVQVADLDAPVVARGESEAEAVDTRYLRIPGARIAEGRLAVVAFPRGVLTPRIDHPYQLVLGETRFSLTVQNGLRSKAGVAYGQGAVYTVQVGEQTIRWHLDGGSGWDTRVLAAADLDSDGQPDFIVQIGDQEVLLLSSRAQPGRNVPAAVLAVQSHGC
ncbi:MAG: hypothetical protein ABIT82_03650 [Ramlibacter sp.]